MKNLLCENVAIILNPHLKDLVLLHRNYTIRNIYHKVDEFTYNKWFYFFDYGTFGTRKLKITLEDLESCYITDVINGELIPIYMQVPCGKCRICRDKLAREWATRAVCEGQTSIGKPIFVTLTYNDGTLPSDGVNKRHLQGFFKRLRINLERYLGVNAVDYPKLRFFACSEYGSKTGRAHYHALIWNMPNMMEHHYEELFEKSWSFMVSKSEYEKYPKDWKFYDEHAKRHRVRFGFVKFSDSNSQRVKYCMKYMRKDCNIPQGQNDIFFLSSRRKGLGYQWAITNLDDISEPRNLDVKIADIWSDTIYTGPLPRYFKDIVYPSLSHILPKDIRDCFKLFNYKLNIQRQLLGEYAPKDYYSDDKELIDKYRCLPFHKFTDMPNFYRTALRVELSNTRHFYDDYSAHVKNLSLELEDLRKKLWSYEFDCREYEDVQQRKNQRIYYMGRYIDSLLDISVSDKVAQIVRNRVRQRNNEIL